MTFRAYPFLQSTYHESELLGSGIFIELLTFKVQPTRSYPETAVIPPECAEIKEHMAQ